MQEEMDRRDEGRPQTTRSLSIHRPTEMTQNWTAWM